MLANNKEFNDKFHLLWVALGDFFSFPFFSWWGADLCQPERYMWVSNYFWMPLITSEINHVFLSPMFNTGDMFNKHLNIFHSFFFFAHYPPLRWSYVFNLFFKSHLYKGFQPQLSFIPSPPIFKRHYYFSLTLLTQQISYIQRQSTLLVPSSVFCPLGNLLIKFIEHFLFLLWSWD